MTRSVPRKAPRYGYRDPPPTRRRGPAPGRCSPPAVLTPAARGGLLLLRLLPAGGGRGQGAGGGRGSRLHHPGAVLGVEEQGGPGLLQEGLRDAGQERAAPHHRLHPRRRRTGDRTRLQPPPGGQEARPGQRSRTRHRPALPLPI